MTITIPRAEIHAIAARYGDHLWYHADPEAEEVRRAADYRRSVGNEEGGGRGGTLIAAAGDLDALVDRIEREATS